jgi:hypothetical protein
MPVYELQDIDARVLDRLDGNSLLYPLAQRTKAINESLKVINLFSPFSLADMDVTGGTVAGQQFYTVPAGLIFPLHVYFNGRQLQKLSLRSASTKYRTWTTNLSNQSIPVLEWIPCGINLFGIHPIDRFGGNTLTVNGVTEPHLLVSPTDTVSIEDEFIEMAEELSASVLQIKESTPIFGQASLIYQKFMRDMKGKMRWTTVKFGRYWLLQNEYRPQPRDQDPDQNQQQAA